MNDQERTVLIQAARSSLVTFVNLALDKLIPNFEHYAYFDLIAVIIEEIVAPPLPGRLVINLPPRHGKSFLLIAAAAWYLGRYPEREVMLVAHAQSLTRDLAAKLCHFLDSALFREVFPRFRMLAGREATTDFRTSEGGGFFAGSFDTGMTGRGADLLLIDDAISAHDVQSVQRREFVRTTFDGMFATRLNDLRTGAIVAISHRLHADDLSAHLLGSGYQHLCLPFRAERAENYQRGGVVFNRKAGELLQPGRISEEDATALATLPAHVFATQYQQVPTAIGAGLLAARHFPIVDTCPAGGTTIVSWDVASSTREGASFSVALVFDVHRDVAYLRHICRERLDYASLKRRAFDLHERFRPAHHLVEMASLGKSLASDLREFGANVIDINLNRASKEDRVASVLNKIEATYVQLVRGTPNLAEFLDECLAFPHGTNDDQVDALSQFLGWQGPPRPGPPLIFRRIGGTAGPNTKAGAIDKFMRTQGALSRPGRSRWR